MEHIVILFNCCFSCWGWDGVKGTWNFLTYQHKGHWAGWGAYAL